MVLRPLFLVQRKEGKTNHRTSGCRRKQYLSPLRYVQRGYKIASLTKVEGDRLPIFNRGDGIRQVSLCVTHRPGAQYERVRQLSIVYDKLSGRLEARLTVEVKANPSPPGKGRVALDLGETILMTAAFDNGRKINKSVRQYWQKVR